jgi:hypothetical protein
MRSLGILVLLGVSSAASADTLFPLPNPAPRPITEVDVYRDMARFWTLAGMERSILVGAGGGYAGGGVASFDLAYRRDTFRSAWDLLPTTVATGVWNRGDRAVVPLSIGWTLPLGLFNAPYVAANALALWSPASSDVDLGFEVGLGYELRASVRWSITADVRFVGAWQVNDRAMDDRSPWGVRAAVGFRRYLD